MRILTTAMVLLGLWLLGTFLVPSPRVVEVKETASEGQPEPDTESDAASISSKFQAS